MKVIPHTNEIIALKVRVHFFAPPPLNRWCVRVEYCVAHPSTRKVREVNEVSETWITIFDLEGNFRLEPRWKLLVDRRIKYEGLAFL
jgi:hypothetical protein